MLTEREAQVLNALALGASNGEIADELVISQRTVRAHVGSLLRKTGTRDRLSLVLYALKHEFLSIDALHCEACAEESNDDLAVGQSEIAASDL